MSWISPEQARTYLERWKKLRDVSVVEWRAASMETRIRQLSVLVDSSQRRGADPERARGAADVRERWARIRRAANG
ncbi:MAG: hypothetical protein ABI356_10805 [Steroidobacteraceae bacterium]